MNLFTIAAKSIRQRALASALTALSVALGVTLMVTVLVIYGTFDQMFGQTATGYDLVVGPKGSRLQLVLNTIYRVSQPIENLPYRFYRELAKDKRIAVAIPFALGDLTQEGAFPIVGTTPEYFVTEYMPGRKFRLQGALPSHPFHAVIGSAVASKNKWGVGDSFQMIHGGQDDHVHEERFTIVGVMQQTGTPNDKTVFVNLDGFLQIDGHEKPLEEALQREREFFGDIMSLPPEVEDHATTDSATDTTTDAATPNVQAAAPDANSESLTAAPSTDKEQHAEEAAPAADAHATADAHDDHGHAGHHHHEVHEAQKEVTAILLQMKAPFFALQLENQMKEGLKAQAVNPIREIRWLMDNIVGNIRTTLVVMTALIIIVSGVSIFVSIYNSMADRRKEIAVMRALGASRQAVFSIILAESTLLCFGGGIFGLLLGHGMVFIAAPIVEARSGFLLNPFAFEPLELILLPTLIVLASLIGFIPGMTAYRTDVAKALAE